MSTLLPFIIAGITTGAVYGVAGSGLVLTYRTSGIFNFAYGAVAAASAYVFYGLTVELGMNWELAFVLSVPVLGTAVGLLFELGARRMSRTTVALQVVATVGVIVAVEAVASLKYGIDPLRVSQYLPGGTGTFRLGGVYISWDQLIVTIVALALTCGLYYMLRWTRLGVSMRAVVDDPALAELHGTSAVSVRRVAWIVGSTLASLSGVLLAPITGVQAISLTYLVLAAIGAAAFGAFSSIPMTYLGGIVIGVLAALSEKYVVTVPWLGGIPLSLPFIILVIALVVLPRHRLAARAAGVRRAPARQSAPRAVAAPAAVIVIVVLLLIPNLVGTHLPYYMQGVTMGIMLLSLGLLVRTAGQISLCQAAFAAIGAIAFSELMTDYKFPWGVALVIGAAATIPLAALVAALALRLSGLFLAIATLAFGIMVEQLIYPTSIGFGSGGLSRLMPRPSVASSDHAYYYLLVGFLVLIAAAVVLIDRSRLGRMLKGLADSPTAMSMMGLTVSVTKVIVFCVSAFIAGISGILYGATVTYATNGDSTFSSFQSLILLTILAIAPFGVPWYALFGIAAVVIPGYFHSASFPYWLNLIFGLAAIVVAIQGGVTPAPKAVSALFRRLRPARAVEPVFARTAVMAPDSENRAVRAADLPLRPGLMVEDLRVQFGGLVAVDGVSLDAPIGRITGLIGPNGAGKTTTFNACCGQVRPSAGSVLLHGRDVTGDPPQVLARMGLRRTFQVTELCDSLSVRENVALGREASLAGASPITQVAGSRSSRRAVNLAAAEALDLCGISRLAEVQAGLLSTGQRRLVEVARCLAGDFDMLLLDEPSAGLDHDETDNLCQVLETVIRQRQCGILLVEHDMALVMRTCDHIYVLDFGRPLFDGTPDEVVSSPVVQSAYLGSGGPPAEGAVDADVVPEAGR